MNIGVGNFSKPLALRSSETNFNIEGYMPDEDITANLAASFLSELKANKIKGGPPEMVLKIETLEVIYDPKMKNAILIAKNGSGSTPFSYNPTTGFTLGVGVNESHPCKSLFDALGTKRYLETMVEKFGKNPDVDFVRREIRRELQEDVRSPYENPTPEDLQDELDKMVQSETERVLAMPAKLEAVNKEIAQMKSVLNYAIIPVNAK